MKIEDIPKMKTEELVNEYLMMRNETDWSNTNPTEFNAKRVLINEMAEEIRRRRYGKSEQTRTDNSGKTNEISISSYEDI